MAAAKFDMWVKHLDDLVKEEWRQITETNPLARYVRQNKVDKELYYVLISQNYHYTKHNARNQALVGVRSLDAPDAYTSFCFHHAHEETGHENMALHDLRTLNLGHKDLVPMTPETETFIAYVYWVASTGSPFRRLGYSFWAESVYVHIDGLLAKIKADLALAPKQMTFFVAHSAIDEEHAVEVRKILELCPEEQWPDVENVMLTTIRLTGSLLTSVYNYLNRQN